MYCVYKDIEDLLRPQLQFGDFVERGQITPDVLDGIFDDSDGMIDGDLSHIYVVPLRKYHDKGILKYPQQIITAAALKASSILINKYFSETEPSLSERAKEFDDRYWKIIIPIQSGDTLLRGQRRRARSHFISPSIQEATGGQEQGWQKKWQV